jgi:hypothetical protein
VGRIWRGIEQEKPSFLPNGTHLSNRSFPVNTGIIKHNVGRDKYKTILLYVK